MGSVRVSEIGFGKDIHHAYNIAQQEAAEEMGHQQGYSGAINSCNPVTKIKPPFRYGTKRFDKWLDEYEINKRDCFGFEITGKLAVELKKLHGYSKSTVKPFFFFGEAPN